MRGSNNQIQKKSPSVSFLALGAVVRHLQLISLCPPHCCVPTPLAPSPVAPSRSLSLVCPVPVLHLVLVKLFSVGFPPQAHTLLLLICALPFTFVCLLKNGQLCTVQPVLLGVVRFFFKTLHCSLIKTCPHSKH